MAIEIPKQLRIKGLRFILVGKKLKRPIEKDWVEENNYEWNDPKLQKHLAADGNYGVLCGIQTEKGFFVVADGDEKKFAKEILKFAKDTFIVKTGGDGKHFYLFLDEKINKIVLQKDGTHFGELQSTGSQVVGPNSIHPSGNTYKIINNNNIKKVKLADLLFALAPYREEVNKVEKEIKKEYKSYGNSDVSQISITQVVNISKLKKRGSDYQGENPWHGSETKMNFCVSTQKGVAYCFRCGVGISPIKALALNNGIIGTCSEKLDGEKFKQTLEIAYDNGLLKRPVTTIKKEYSSAEEAYLGIKKFNKPTYIFVPREGLIFQNTSLGYKNDVSYFEQNYKIYKAVVGAGNKPIAIFTDRYDKVEIGESKLYLLPASEQELRKILKDMLKESFFFEFLSQMSIGIATKDRTLEDILDEII